LIVFTASAGLCEENIITGLWSGQNIIFNISEDGTKITAINSPILDGLSLVGHSL
jgi:hypothetical protein